MLAFNIKKKKKYFENNEDVRLMMVWDCSKLATSDYCCA